MIPFSFLFHLLTLVYPFDFFFSFDIIFILLNYPVLTALLFFYEMR
jgi:hypothetical protein